ncbi:MAG: hypothetical protein LBN42_03320 [Oscillospiraceae bacterium]|jgi:galactose mutarotase-like enzyme|nr:hypothetical protein [Oscillospiraceae bacterium]
MSIEIRYSDANRATIFERGAELKSLHLTPTNPPDTGGDWRREILWQGDPTYWGRTSPLLFPMVGALKGDETTIGTRKVNIPKHGFCRDADFIMSQTASNEVVFTKTADEETYAMFPFRWTLRVHYRILAGRIKMTYIVTNNETKREMPYCIGAHPAFNIPFGNKFEDDYDTFGNYKIIFDKEENTQAVKFDIANGHFDPRLPSKKLNGNVLRLKHTDYLDDCLYYPELNSNSLLITRDGASGVRVTWENYTGVAFWTPMPPNDDTMLVDDLPPPADFLCVEPWCGSADWFDSDGIFANKRGIEKLQPSETKRYSVTIGIE